MKPLAVGLVAAACLAVGVAVGMHIPGPAQSILSAGPRVEQARETLAIADPPERLEQWSALLARSRPDDLSALREAVAAAPVEAGSPEIVAFATWWADFDPVAALGWTDAEWRAQSRPVYAAVFRVWGFRDPAIAFARAATIPQFYRDASIDAVIVGWHESGKPGLVERVQSLPEGPFRQRVGEGLARRVVLERGTEAALQWVEGLPESGFRDEMTMRIASAATEQGDPAVIAAWAVPHITKGTERGSGLARRIATRWVLRDPEAALAWLESLPAGRDREDGVTETFRDWMRYSRADAVQWIEKAELEPWAEPAFAIYARWLANDQKRPKDGLDLAARFSDEILRDRTTTVILRKWSAQDPDATRSWMAKADLPDDVRARAETWVRNAARP